MEGVKSIEFREGEMLVKTLHHESDLKLASRLRHRVFAEQLGWVPCTRDGMEIDMYDLWGTMVGLFHRDGRLLAMTRLLSSTGFFMLEKDLSALLPAGYHLRKEADTAEITRLAIDPEIRDRGLSHRLLLTLLKGIYQWSIANEVRYFYLEVEHRFFRTLRAMGLLCEPLGLPVMLPPAQAPSIAARLDIQSCEEQYARRQPQLLEWMATFVTPSGNVIRQTMTKGVLLGESACAADVPVKVSEAINPQSIAA